MYFARIVLAAFLLAPLSSAAPVKRGLFSSIANGFKGATLGGIAGTIAQSIENPKLTAARLQVVKGLTDTTVALNRINRQAGTTGNSGVTTLVATAQGGIGSAHQGVSNIGGALLSGQKPATADQKQVAVGIKAAKDAIDQMSAAITTADPTLTNDITTAQGAVSNLEQGGLNVLSASGLSFAALGLPANFAQ